MWWILYDIFENIINSIWNLLCIFEGGLSSNVSDSIVNKCETRHFFFVVLEFKLNEYFFYIFYVLLNTQGIKYQKKMNLGICSLNKWKLCLYDAYIMLTLTFYIRKIMKSVKLFSFVFWFVNKQYILRLLKYYWNLCCYK